MCERELLRERRRKRYRYKEKARERERERKEVWIENIRVRKGK